MTQPDIKFSYFREVVQGEVALYDLLNGALKSLNKYPANDINAVIKVAKFPRSTIITSMEIARLYKSQGEDFDLEAAIETKNNLDLVLGIGEKPEDGNAHKISSPVKPLSQHRLPDSSPSNPRQGLFVGHFPAVILQRTKAKQAVLGDFGLEKAPRGVWVPDEVLTEVQLAVGGNSVRNKIFDDVVKLVRDDKLPTGDIVLGKTDSAGFDPESGDVL